MFFVAFDLKFKSLLLLKIPDTSHKITISDSFSFWIWIFLYIFVCTRSDAFRRETWTKMIHPWLPHPFATSRRGYWRPPARSHHHVSKNYHFRSLDFSVFHFLSLAFTARKSMTKVEVQTSLCFPPLVGEATRRKNTELKFRMKKHCRPEELFAVELFLHSMFSRGVAESTKGKFSLTATQAQNIYSHFLSLSHRKPEKNRSNVNITFMSLHLADEHELLNQIARDKTQPWFWV